MFGESILAIKTKKGNNIIQHLFSNLENYTITKKIILFNYIFQSFAKY